MAITNATITSYAVTDLIATTSTTTNQIIFEDDIQALSTGNVTGTTYVGRLIVLRRGTSTEEFRIVTSDTLFTGTTRRCVVDTPWVNLPAINDTIEVFHNLQDIQAANTRTGFFELGDPLNVQNNAGIFVDSAELLELEDSKGGNTPSGEVQTGGIFHIGYRNANGVVQTSSIVTSVNNGPGETWFTNSGGRLIVYNTTFTAPVDPCELDLYVGTNTFISSNFLNTTQVATLSGTYDNCVFDSSFETASEIIFCKSGTTATAADGVVFTDCVFSRVPNVQIEVNSSSNTDPGEVTFENCSLVGGSQLTNFVEDSTRGGTGNRVSIKAINSPDFVNLSNIVGSTSSADSTPYNLWEYNRSQGTAADIDGTNLADCFVFAGSNETLSVNNGYTYTFGESNGWTKTSASGEYNTLYASTLRGRSDGGIGGPSSDTRTNNHFFIAKYGYFPIIQRNIADSINYTNNNVFSEDPYIVSSSPSTLQSTHTLNRYSGNTAPSLTHLTATGGSQIRYQIRDFNNGAGTIPPKNSLIFAASNLSTLNIGQSVSGGGQFTLGETVAAPGGTVSEGYIIVFMNSVIGGSGGYRSSNNGYLYTTSDNTSTGTITFYAECTDETEFRYFWTLSNTPSCQDVYDLFAAKQTGEFFTATAPADPTTSEDFINFIDPILRSSSLGAPDTGRYFATSDNTNFQVFPGGDTITTGYSFNTWVPNFTEWGAGTVNEIRGTEYDSTTPKTWTPPVAYNLSVTGLLGNSEVRVYNNPSRLTGGSTSTEAGGVETVAAFTDTGNGTNYISYNTGGANVSVDITGTLSGNFTTAELANGDTFRVLVRDNANNPTLQLFDEFTVSGTPTSTSIPTSTASSGFTSVFGTAITGSNSKTVTIEKVSATETFSNLPPGNYDIAIFRIASRPIYLLNQSLTGNTSIPVTQAVDRVYNNPA